MDNSNGDSGDSGNNDDVNSDGDDENSVSGGSNDDVTMSTMMTLVIDSGGGNGDADCDKEKHLLRYVTLSVLIFSDHFVSTRTCESGPWWLNSSLAACKVLKESVLAQCSCL